MSTDFPKRGFGQRIRDKLRRIARHRRFLASIRHLHGPERLETPPGATIVVSVIKDGTYYLDAFLDHYRAMGIAHFVFVDNGSTDGTVARIAGEPGTVVLRSDLPTSEFQPEFRRHAAERFCTGRWCLFADIDELFDFEGRDRHGITALTGYLEEHGYDAVMAQMLDLFPDMPLRQTDGMGFADAIDQYRFYDLTHISRIPYHDTEALEFSWFLRNNTLGDDRLAFLFGGVRKRVFDENCCLTKHPLVFVGGAVEPGVHPHCSANLRCADFSALLRHYKFTDDPVGRDVRSIRERTVRHGADRQRLRAYEADPDLTLFSPDAQRYEGFGPLYRDGFLIRSDRYAAHLARLDAADDA